MLTGVTYETSVVSSRVLNISQPNAVRSTFWAAARSATSEGTSEGGNLGSRWKVDLFGVILRCVESLLVVGACFCLKMGGKAGDSRWSIE